MVLFLVLALAVSMVAGFFALQNAVPITVTLLLWTFEGSLALVLLVAFAGGALVGVLLVAPALIKARLTIARQNSEINDLKKIAASPALSSTRP
ncbi:MAG TPA: LapA family protein [Candidatus Acidoferrales bacterium]|nr:LapA family protein [Candidatus Acidoferrales bacterium]